MSGLGVRISVVSFGYVYVTDQIRVHVCSGFGNIPRQLARQCELEKRDAEVGGVEHAEERFTFRVSGFGFRVSGFGFRV